MVVLANWQKFIWVMNKRFGAGLSATKISSRNPLVQRKKYRLNYKLKQNTKP